MTPLDFFISVKNSEAMDGMAEVQAKLDHFQKTTDALYDGPAREMKIRSEIRGMIKDISMGESPVYAMVNVLERLSEMAKWAAGAGALLAVTFAVGQQLEKAADEADKLKKRLTDALSTPVENESISDLKKDVVDLDDIAKDYDKQGWLTKFLYGMQIDPMARAASQLKDMKVDLIALRELTDDTRAAEARSLLASPNLDDQLKGRSMQQALANEKEMDRVKDDNKTAEKNLADHQAAMATLESKYEAAQLSRKHASRHVNGLLTTAEYNEQRAALEQLMASDKAVLDQGSADLAAVKKAGEDELTKIQRDSATERGALREKESQAQLAAELELENAADKTAILRRRIGTDEGVEMLGATPADRDQAKTKEMQDRLALARETYRLENAATEQAQKIEELRQQTLRAQFEALDKEDQIVVLRAAQVRLQGELSRVGIYSDDGKLKLQKELADVTRQLNEDQKRMSPWAGIDAETALRGSMSAGVFGRVTNDAANRSEKHLETMEGYLKTIASRGNVDDLGAF